jgi:hypothetical protein
MRCSDERKLLKHHDTDPQRQKGYPMSLLWCAYGLAEIIRGDTRHTVPKRRQSASLWCRNHQDRLIVALKNPRSAVGARWRYYLSHFPEWRYKSRYV